MFCRNCGKEVDEKAVVCVSCGVPPKTEKKFCNNCGEKTEENQALCIKCGVSLSTSSGSKIGSSDAKWESKGPKSKGVAGALGILLGWLGAHKFYLGYTMEGVIMLVVTLITFGMAGFIVGTIGFIEGIMYLMKSEEDFTAAYVDNKKGWF